MARIDDRLIHGQVVTAWLRALGRCDEILICDDETRSNQFLQQVLMAVAPPDKAVRVLSVEETIADFREKVNDPRRVLLLARSPEPMLRLLEGGVRFAHLNVGGMGAGPGRKNLLRALSLSEAEFKTLHQIQTMGVRAELKMVPDERGTDLSELKWN